MGWLRAFLGIAVFCGLAWSLSSRRDRFPWRVVLLGIGLQFALAALTLGTATGYAVFEWLGGCVQELIRRTAPATELVFGDLARPDGPGGFIFAFASSGLPIIIVYSALMGVLYHLGVMQVVIYGMARLMTVTLRVSGAEATAMAANVFVGNTEAPLVVKPYLERMTVSELNALMCGGFATIAGSVMAVYMGLLGPEIGPHLITASVMSAPAAFVIAKILVPETEAPVTGGELELRVERSSSNLVEAAAVGTQDGLKLWLNVLAMLIAFVALVQLIDWPLGRLGELLGGTELSLGRLFGLAFAPFAWLLGADGWNDVELFGRLLGTKVTVNEFLAFTQLTELTRPALDAAGSARAFEDPRLAKIAAYALCGFANFGSIGVQIGGLTPLAPGRRTDIARLALRAMAGGALASWMTACVAGLFVT